jgi:PHD/YefM family antitoxin component YafN of YafNO toxin-antitoxin module
VGIARKATATSCVRIADVQQRYDRILTAEATMIDSTPDVQPLTAFRDNPAEFLEQLKATHRPIALTVDGHPEFIIQEAAEYERMLDLLEAADVRDAIRRGLEDVEAGRTRPAEEFFEEMRQKYAIPR